VAFSPDSQTVASGAGGVYDNEYADYTVKLWDVETGAEQQTLSGHRDRVQAIAFSPQGDILASGGSDRTIRIWDRDSGEEVRSVSTDGSYISDLALSPDGQTLVSGGSDGVRVWNWRAGELRQTLARGEGQVNAIALSSDGGALVSGGESGRVALWDLSTGRLKKVLQAGGDFGAIAVVECRRSPDRGGSGEWGGEGVVGAVGKEGNGQPLIWGFASEMLYPTLSK
jgi:WD40 repeat protein